MRDDVRGSARRRQSVDELVGPDDGDRALLRPDAAEPGDPFAGEIFHFREAGGARGFNAVRALRPAAIGIEGDTTNAERGQRGEGLRIEARARVAGVADEREVLAEEIIQEGAPSLVGANLRLRNRPPFGPIAAPPRKPEVGAVADRSAAA